MILSWNAVDEIWDIPGHLADNCGPPMLRWINWEDNFAETMQFRAYSCIGFVGADSAGNA